MNVFYIWVIVLPIYHIDSQENTPTMINTYSIIVPYLTTKEKPSDAVEFSIENGSPIFHLPYFFGILNSQVLLLCGLDK